jgi:ribosomal protein S18 acetylase RimI-like enzyme
MTLTLAPFSETSPYLEDAAHVYLATWPDDPEKIRAFLTRYAGYPDFCGCVALLEQQVIGMGFGHRSRPGDWWHDRVANALGPDHPALQNAWVLVELAVLPDHRGQGIGKALHQALLSGQPCPCALLSTEISNTRARGFYEGLGRQYIERNFRFSPEAEPFVIMARSTPPTAKRAEQ